jgi:hypothetical protein
MRLLPFVSTVPLNGISKYSGVLSMCHMQPTLYEGAISFTYEEEERFFAAV